MVSSSDPSFFVRRVVTGQELPSSCVIAIDASEPAREMEVRESLGFESREAQLESRPILFLVVWDLSKADCTQGDHGPLPSRMANSHPRGTGEKKDKSMLILGKSCPSV